MEVRRRTIAVILVLAQYCEFIFTHCVEDLTLTTTADIRTEIATSEVLEAITTALGDRSLKVKAEAITALHSLVQFGNI